MKHSLKLILISSTILFASSESLPRPAGPEKGARLTIGVHIYNDVRVPNEQVGAAEEVASRVLRQAGVELKWSDCTVSRSASGSLSSPCDSPAQSGALVVYFVGPLEAHFHWVDENALACSIIPQANEPATMTYISYPRIRTLSDSTSAGVADLLGLAVAHEIAHLLLGSHEHAYQGIMRAYWPWQDLHAEAWGKFQFSRDEANRLRTAVQARLQADNLGINRPQDIDHSPIVQMATERYASLLLMGLGVSEALSQQTQSPGGVQTPRAEISLTELSDLRRRADVGDGKAQNALGRIYMVGLGVSQDYPEAARWYERAAEQGFVAAQFMMGFLYEQGKGVHRDYTRALEYYRAAADQGHATAANNLANLYLHGLGVPKDIRAALKWYQFSAEHGDATGQCNLATFYFVGKDVPKDYHEAARWFRAAAEQGFPAAENNLAFLYFTGEGVVQDYGEAFKWMSRAAEQGYAQAQINLGDLYVEGKGVSLDYVTAYMWYSLGSTGDRRAATRIKNLSRLITPKQRIEGENRARAWLSSHRSPDVNE